MTGRPAVGIAIVSALLGVGCSIAPKSFVQVNDPAPLVRARALGLGQGMADSEVVPTLIAQLNDPDAVVRMTAFEQLKQRTGQDFGYKPWGDPHERAPSVAAWRSWWNGQQGRAYASSQSGQRVTPTQQRRGLFRRR